MADKAKINPKRIVFSEADNYKILKAAQVVRDEGIAKPILLGDKNKINKIAEENFIDLSDMQILDPFFELEDKKDEFGDILWQKRQRRGLTQYDARKLMRDRNYFGAMMVETGMADAMISGLTRKYGQPIKPALEIISTLPGVSKVCRFVHYGY